MPKKKSQRNYIDNQKFYNELKKYTTAVKEANRIGKPKPLVNDYIGECFWKIAENLSHLHKFQKYPYREEMCGDAITNCLHRDTKILTLEHGPISIGDVVGKTVTVKSADGIWRPAKVKSYGTQELIKIKIASFNVKEKNILHEVIATKNHRWFVQARLKKNKCFDWNKSVIDDIKIGDMLDYSPYLDGIDKDGLIHGLIFGDGTGHKSVADKTAYGNLITSYQGSKYASIRVCAKDIVRDEIISILRDGGYAENYPNHAHGDPVFHIGKFPFVKNVPHTIDPSYINGFIYGWWLADGSKTIHVKGRWQISTINEEAVEWMKKYAALGGYIVTGIRKKINPDRGFGNAKPLFVITLAKPETYKARIRSIEPFGEDEVFCVEEPVTRGFVLANGLLTGNCLQYIDNFDPEKSQNPFAYFTQISFYAFIRRIEKEKKYLYTKFKAIENMEIFYTSDDDTNTGFSSGYSEGAKENMTDFVEKFETSMEKKRVKNKITKDK